MVDDVPVICGMHSCLVDQAAMMPALVVLLFGLRTKNDLKGGCFCDTIQVAAAASDQLSVVEESHWRNR